MSRIGKKPIAIPKGVTVKFEGNTVLVQGPKGKLDTALPSGIKMEQKDGNLVAIRENDSQAALHGLARALVNNAVDGVTKGWTRELEIVGIGYRAELKGKGIVVFNLGYSHPIEYPLPSGVDCAVDPKQTRLTLTGIDRQKVGQQDVLSAFRLPGRAEGDFGQAPASEEACRGAAPRRPGHVAEN